MLIEIKGHNSFVNLQTLTCNNPELELIKGKTHAKFYQIPLTCSQNIEWKRNLDNNQGP